MEPRAQSSHYELRPEVDRGRRRAFLQIGGHDTTPSEPVPLVGELHRVPGCGTRRRRHEPETEEAADVSANPVLVFMGLFPSYRCPPAFTFLATCPISNDLQHTGADAPKSGNAVAQEKWDFPKVPTTTHVGLRRSPSRSVWRRASPMSGPTACRGGAAPRPHATTNPYRSER